MTLEDEFNNFVEQGEYGEARKVINQLMMETTDDDGKKNLKENLVHLEISDERFDEALKVLEDESVGMAFERSYCYYRIGKYQRAFNILAKVKEDHHHHQSIEMRILKAQIYYRLEKYSEAVKVYEELIREGVDDGKMMVNLWAARTALVTVSNPKDDSLNSFENSQTNSHEIQYNKSCYLATIGRYEEALEMAESAIKGYHQDKMKDDDDLDEERRESELRQFKEQFNFIKYHQIGGDPSRSSDDFGELNQLILNGTASSSKIEKFLTNLKWNPIQRKFILFNLGLAFLREGKKLKSAAKIFRSLLRFKTLSGLSTGCLYVVLRKLNLIQEIRERCKESELMRLSDLIWKVEKGHRPISDLREYCERYPSITGIIIPRILKRSKVKNIDSTLIPDDPVIRTFYERDNISDVLKGLLEIRDQTKQVKVSIAVAKALLRD